MRAAALFRDALFMVVLGVIAAGCGAGSTKSPEVSDRIRKDLDDANLKDVSVRQDRDKGVVTLEGHVRSDLEKSQAESIGKADADGQVIADEIAVKGPGNDNSASTVSSDLDQGIEKNLDAALLQNKMDKEVRHDVKNGVVTLKGEVNSEAKRARAESVASHVPNVQQVVNELDVKDQKATSSR